MTTDPDAEHIRRILRQQAENERLEQPPPKIAQYLGGPKHSNEQPLGQRIAQTAHRLTQQIADANLQPQIVAKIARAIEEGRIPEGEIAQILACMHLAKNRGAYFVAASKKAFGRNNLSWHTEDWR